MIHSVLGVNIQDLDNCELNAKLSSWLAGREGHVIVTPNAEFLLETRKNFLFLDLLNNADLAVADSVSIQYAVAALSEHRLIHRVPGVDLLRRLCKLASERHKRVLLLGGNPGCAKQASRCLGQQFSNLNIVALNPGRISWNEKRQLLISDALIKKLIELEPNIIAVGLGQFKQEQFIDQVRRSLPDVNIWIGVGGAFEMLSGHKKRAPHWVSRIGFEWLWRLFIEPRRWRRIFNASIAFPIMVAWQAFRQGHFIRSCKRVFLEIVQNFRV